MTVESREARSVVMVNMAEAEGVFVCLFVVFLLFNPFVLFEIGLIGAFVLDSR